MQEPAGVDDEMSTVNLITPVCPASCEKNTLFRYGILLPKIKCPSIIRSGMDQSIMFLVSIMEMFQLKTGIGSPGHPLPMTKKQKRPVWNPIAHDTRLSSSSVNPKLNQWLESDLTCTFTQLWIDAYSKGWMIFENVTLSLSGSCA